MENNIQAVMAHIQEIEARMSALNPPAAPPIAPKVNGTGAANRPFDVMLAQANGGISLRGVGGTGAFAPEVEGLITKYAGQNGLSPDLVRAVIQQESGGNAKSVSAVGAQGLMQLMPETAAGYGVQNALDPEQNIMAGTRHLAGLLREFNGNLPSALAAYNAGAGAVKRAGGVPNYPETQQYVRRIMGMLGSH